jgi:hypothetical protein
LAPPARLDPRLWRLGENRHAKLGDGLPPSYNDNRRVLAAIKYLES